MKEGGHISSGLEQNSGRKYWGKKKTSRENGLRKEIMPKSLGVGYQVLKRGFIKENKLLDRLGCRKRWFLLVVNTGSLNYCVNTVNWKE